MQNKRFIYINAVVFFFFFASSKRLFRGRGEKQITRRRNLEHPSTPTQSILRVIRVSKPTLSSTFLIHFVPRFLLSLSLYHTHKYTYYIFSPPSFLPLYPLFLFSCPHLYQCFLVVFCGLRKRLYTADTFSKHSRNFLVLKMKC